MYVNVTLYTLYNCTSTYIAPLYNCTIAPVKSKITSDGHNDDDNSIAADEKGRRAGQPLRSSCVYCSVVNE